ncbi:unnamed protein product [Alternaria alternata]
MLPIDSTPGRADATESSRRDEATDSLRKSAPCGRRRKDNETSQVQRKKAVDNQDAEFDA